MINNIYRKYPYFYLTCKLLYFIVPTYVVNVDSVISWSYDHVVSLMV